MRRRASLALLALCAAPAVAAAAVFGEASVEEVARTSDAVVRGRVERLSARWSGDGRRILTDVEVRVSAVWKGAAPERVRITVPGGRIGRVAQRVDAAPAFAEGEEVVVFLARRGAGFRVAGSALGAYRVERGQARPTVAAPRLARRTLPRGERAVEPMAVAELERRVRGAG